MSQNISAKEAVKNFLQETPKEFDYFIQHSMDFSIQLSNLLKTSKISQKEFAAILSKEESEVSKWMSGNHNFTLKSISKIEAALDQQLIFTRKEIIERFLPFIFRNWKSTYIGNSSINSLITYYTVLEQTNAVPFSFPTSLVYNLPFSKDELTNNCNSTGISNNTFSNNSIIKTNCITTEAA